MSLVEVTSTDELGVDFRACTAARSYDSFNKTSAENIKICVLLNFQTFIFHRDTDKTVINFLS